MTIARLEQWVTVQAGLRPDAPAVVLDGDALSYGELDVLSTRLARRLIRDGCRKGDRVALLMPKSPLAIASIVAIYKAGAVYVPLDPAGPAGRLATICESAAPRWILSAGGAAAMLAELARIEAVRDPMRVAWLEFGAPPEMPVPVALTRAEVEVESAASLPAAGAGQDAAHILFTSGSTGAPKGVVITHANVIPFVEWAVSYFDMRPGERNSGHPPLHFDLSMLDIFGTFASGGELHLVPPELGMLAHRLAEFIRSRALAQWFSVPSLLNYLAAFDAVRMHDFPHLRRLLWCGEVFPTPALMYWMRRLPHVRFTNLYGPTETTIASSYYTVPACPDEETAAVPIGTACPGEALLVLDEELRPAPAGEVGELYIGGAGLSPGYWGDPARTAAAFVADPRTGERLYRTGDLARVGHDGLAYFHGRTDTQIKSRGYRIELGEIETAVRKLDGVADCAVVAVPSDGFEGAVICCAYVARPGAGLAPAPLRAALSRVLPGYMLPFRWLALGSLPTNANGKTDRRTLQQAFQALRTGEAQPSR
ncbi:MAG TPA: amino acid adenylation domain-containing protein [Gemmatimonadales bacterium]|nr:amino acid adenylation domain-containing protein [Gemmatimonadales bacterium]